VPLLPYMAKVAVAAITGWVLAAVLFPVRHRSATGSAVLVSTKKIDQADSTPPSTNHRPLGGPEELNAQQFTSPLSSRTTDVRRFTRNNWLLGPWAPKLQRRRLDSEPPAPSRLRFSSCGSFGVQGSVRCRASPHVRAGARRWTKTRLARRTGRFPQLVDPRSSVNGLLLTEETHA
jgi:hypothetical protein